ncbi:PREDICTED: probable protein phosphatase 2C 23 [Tarenaya hassleriana]|uniref:probable protein phosphatase 2C 23 n=1 Tax=Tarenaya hassleriana TaxID=28532 RepID=UPI00053C8761|nr:PREDICTED: probable protein phosphatase 2C 23 [Tarenaya hassleriana]
MGNGVGKLSVCFTGGQPRRKKDMSVLVPDPLDEGLGHSFCYVRPDPTRLSSSKVHSEEETTTFRTISGASVSANAATPLSTSLYDPYGHMDRAAAFESTTSFSSIPLQPIPRSMMSSGPIVPGSGPIERGFLSGPIERNFMSGPLDRVGLFSGPLEKSGSDQFQRSFSHGGVAFQVGSRKGSLIRVLRRAISKTIARGQNSIVAPIKGVISVKETDWIIGSDKNRIHQTQQHNENLTVNSLNFSSDGSLDDDVSLQSQNLQWAQGKAGEDRVHVVVSEEHGWLFVGIYDGFNGPDAPDYLLSHLYPAVHRELKGLLWDDPKIDPKAPEFPPEIDSERTCGDESCSNCVDQDNNPCPSGCTDSGTGKSGKKSKNNDRTSRKLEENQRRWRCEWDRERLDLDRLLKEQMNRSSGSQRSPATNHSDVLKALSRALRKTEEAYLEIADKMLDENPELALMGSCVLVMLMKGEDVYVMNVGDSRAVLGQKAEPDYWLWKIKQDLERINEETMNDCDGERSSLVPNLSALQLTVDHSTSVDEEVKRIKNEHPDDAYAVSNERVKGSLKVTRAFGAGFLKQPKWNNALLEMFRIDYIGKSPYINCLPSLYHHRLGPKDRFLILSSDGLYQYFTNEEAISEVELFITLQPEGDPAQHLVEELLFRAAKKAGMDFHELLEIPQGERRRYHDDVSIIVISLEGRMWKSCV